ncbi:MAG: NTP transferase domain-containing protein [Candidatus Eisenbacteria bacterium]|nr:NTP transferase domain-containing protein [Candidatus Eisenbacteria bacterium]
MSSPNTIAIVLAAGQGTRMKSNLAKVLHNIVGRPLIHYVMDSVLEVGFDRNVVVIGFQKDVVRDVLKGYPVEFVEQDEQCGTGHAVQLALRQIRETDGAVAVLSGDSPFLRPSTLKSLVTQHVSSGRDCTVLTAAVKDPKGYGRIVRDASGVMLAIVEDVDCTEEQRCTTEVNSGMYCFRLPSLVSCIELLRNNNLQDELYLTDVVTIMHSKGMKLGTFPAPDWREILGINTVEQLKEGEKILKDLGAGG